ncbi:MAG: Uma2 family endonuclease [Ruminococcus sp.]|jgi:Uma2 family endonuclease|nr:Uma2 family endonuclease [Ruminococcus sp.]
MALPQEKTYTIEVVYALPEGQRAELIDGQMYMMALPNTIHQRISYSVARKISDYIDKKNGGCDVFLAPFAVFLNADDINYVEPDISIRCDKSKLDDRGCNGAPDWIIEILSPSTERTDCGIKLFKYRSAGVREYWNVNPRLRTANVYDFENDEKHRQYSFDDEIPVCIYEDLIIRISDLL